MDNNNDFPQVYDNMNNEDVDNVFSTRYNRYNNRYNNGYDYYDYDRYYDRNYDRDYYRDYDRRMRYYRYPYCDRYGRCENSIWWAFWPLFFL